MKKEEIEFIKTTINEIREEYKLNYENIIYNEEMNNLNEYILQNYQCCTVYEKYRKQICLTFKNVKTKEFYNKFFDSSTIYPKRKSTCPLSYIIYKLSELQDYEIYIACNLLISRADQSRERKNFSFSNILYVDIDTVRGSEFLDINSHNYNEELLKLFHKNYEISEIIKPSQIIASGSGLHLYFCIDTINLFQYEERSKYLNTLSKLTHIYDGDFNCVDIARILRPPCSYNKKNKFSTPKKVEVIESNSKKYTLTEIEQLLYKYKFGNRLVEIEELEDWNKCKFRNNNDSFVVPEGFVLMNTCEKLPFNDNTNTFFSDFIFAENEDIYIDEEENNLMGSSCIDKIIIDVELLEEKTKETKTKKKTDNYFNISSYEINHSFPNQYLIQDLLYYIKNRDGYCKGKRRNLLFIFYFCFKKYVSMNYEESCKYTYKVNQLFKEPLKKDEVYNLLEYLENYKLRNGFRNIKVSKLLEFKPEEIINMRGTYTSDKEEKRNIKLDRDRRIAKSKYKAKKVDKNTIVTYIKSNTEKSDIEIAKLLNMNRSTIYRYRKSLLK